MKKPFLAVVFCLALMPFSLKATCVWFGGVGAWSDAANWSCGHVPFPGDDAVVAGGIVHVDVAVVIHTLIIEGGTLASAGGSITATAALHWKAGTIGVPTTAAPGSAFFMTTAGTKTLAGILTNHSAIATWDGGTFNVNGSFINNGSFGIATAGTIGYTSPMPGTIENNGMFNKPVAGGIAFIKVPFVNNGTLGVTSGTIYFDPTADLTGNGTIFADAGKLIEIYSTCFVNPGAAFDGTGTIHFHGNASINIPYDGALNLGFYAPMIEIKHGWTTTGSIILEESFLFGTGGLKAKGTITWNSGTISLPVIIDPGATLTMTTAAPKKLVNTMTQKGTATWDAGTFYIDGPGGNLVNSGTFNMAFDGLLTFAGATGTFLNTGIFSKTGGGSTGFVDVFIHNAFMATINVNFGTLKIDVSGLTNEGLINIPFGSRLDLNHSSSFTITSDLSGFGSIEFSDGVTTMDILYTGDLDVYFTGAEVIFTATFTTNGTVTFEAGKIRGTSYFIVSSIGVMNWTAGVIEGLVKVNSNAILNLSGSSDKAVTDGYLALYGTGYWTGGDVVVSGTGDFTNFGEFIISSSGAFTYYLAKGTGTVENSGMMDLNGSIQLETYATFYFNDGCSLSGTGSFVVAANTTHVDKNGGLAVSNHVTVAGGNLAVNETFTTTNSATVSGGSVSGIATWSVLGSLDWTGGLIGTKVNIDAGATLSLGGANKTLTDTLAQQGSASWTAGSLTINASGALINSGIMEMSGADSLKFSGTPGMFYNSGTFIKTSTGRAVFLAKFTNTGTVKGVGILERGATFINSGTVAPGTSPGILTIDGAFTNGNMLDIELQDGSGAGSGHDQLIVTTTATLAGTLKVTETGVVPNGSYVVLTCQGGSNCISGNFAALDLPSGYSAVISGTSVTILKAALPVELVFFQATRKGRDVLLEWETATETNNDYFAVERSADGVQFETLVQMPGQGTSGITHAYEWTDRNAVDALSSSDRWYYRLRQVDYNGQFEYSPIKAVYMEGAGKEFAIEKVLSQGQDGLTVYFVHNQGGKVVFSLYDISGRRLATVRSAEESGSVLLPVTGLPTGPYVVTTSAGGAVRYWKGTQ